VVCSLHRPLS